MPVAATKTLSLAHPAGRTAGGQQPAHVRGGRAGRLAGVALRRPVRLQLPPRHGQQDIGGALAGGASLDVDDFARLCAIAAEEAAA